MILQMLKSEFGGGGGNRTHVRKPAALGTTCLVQSLNLVDKSPIDRKHTDESVWF
jgi:hypothetical protein